MKTSIKIIHWTPRILCIIAILFISLFAMDSFGHGNPLLDQIKDFLIHLTPTYILSLLLWLAWKKELIGGIIFTLIGVVFTPIIYNHNFAMNQSVSTSLIVIASITFPFILIGLLFIIGHFLKKKAVSEN